MLTTAYLGEAGRNPAGQSIATAAGSVHARGAASPRRVHVHGFEAVAEGEIGREVRRIARGGGALRQRWEEIWSVVDAETVDRLLFHRPDAAERNRRLWEESGLRNTGEMMRALTRAPESPPLSHRVEGLRVPALVLVGLHDRNVGVDATRDLASALPNARLVVFRESAHFPDLEEPARYAATVRAFLAR